MPIGRALPKTGVYGVAHQGAAAVGVRGSSTGRGGVFYGAVAQLRLEPSKLTERPAIGATGDFFVDAAGDLWFCKGDKNWVQIA